VKYLTDKRRKEEVTDDVTELRTGEVRITGVYTYKIQQI
jgi:hypothetical protein